jgi:acetylglutamate kinase
MERFSIPVEFVDGRRVTTRTGLAVVRSAMAAVSRALCAAIGERALPVSGDEIGLYAVQVPALGFVGDPLPSRPPVLVEALDQGWIPVVSPLGVGPLNLNADEAAAALALGLRADRLLLVTETPGLVVEGAFVDRIDAGSAARLLAGGALDGGFVPTVRAAVHAARAGVPASIGRTAVTI